MGPKEDRKSPSKQPPSNAPQASQEETRSSIFDLHSTVGQVTFIVVVAAIAVLIQALPRDFLSQLLKKDSHEVPVASKVPPVQPAVCRHIQEPSYIIYNPRSEREDHLQHVKAVLERLGFRRAHNESKDWDLMWAHDYPFFKLPELRQLKEHQRVNHFPGSGFLTNKVDLALTESKYIPKAFRLPEDATKFMEYAKAFPEKEFVQKNNKHRHIYLKTIPEIDVNDNETFIQEYMTNPFLVDGKKFDIGAYVVVTSIDPLRIYVYHGDYLLRFCPVEYYPFDRSNLDKYVVGDDYTPTWEIESLEKFHTRMGFSMKDCLDAYVRSLGKDPRTIWDQIHDSIREIVLRKESHLVSTLQRYKSRKNFFELMRFDFIVDENLRVFLLEANMSPNLSSAHFKPNKLLYEQVIYNALKLVGIGSVVRRESLKARNADAEAMMSSMKNIAIDADVCASETCSNAVTETCNNELCQFCRWCLSKDDLEILHTAYREHTNRGDMLRIYPTGKHDVLDDSSLTPQNLFMSKWFSEKCQNDRSWC
uniref:Tubulin polyglutamylase ttll6 n=2 Tax=Lutzomyia longipalpis TaxID=7200 RepID=A0A1B0CSE5_LUTLO